MTYQIPSSPVVSETEEKKSRFLCWLGPVKDKAVFHRQLDLIRTQYPDANHHCTALVIGNPSNPEVMQADDDGEPGGSAGRPMLELLLKQGVGNVGTVVTRYFGGTKLGVGGLMRAYRGAVGVALQGVSLEPFIPLHHVLIGCDFAQEARLRFLVGRCQGSCGEVQYTSEVTMPITLPQNQWPLLLPQLQAEAFQILMNQ
ncbi:YigZ family protein [Microbulbifer sp. OS29]|uniref:YigZ family protein n=1 Tax=Microbulbifer okhotskensis TaxID=2926617 RepID=A0A9X2ENP5_9GAMM|nr:YigZ family protein [Microbulbifer okhotskensis]MCO1334520.1 YigZ family protein [Microbulbifer okhotskensis]